MARLLWLADVLREAGLTVHEYPGWQTRGADTFGPVRGIICHGTGGSLTSTDKGEINVIAITGSRTAPEVPIAQLYQSRSGEWTVIASGTATGVKTGSAGPHKGYSDDALLQIEAQHNGAEPWTQLQYQSYVRGVAALVAKLGVGVAMVAGHYEHQPTEKTDPWFDMDQFRRDVTAVLEGEDMDQDRANNIIATDARLRAVIFNLPYAEFQIPGEPAPRKERNEVHFALKALAEKPAVVVDQAVLEAALRKVLGAVDGATPDN